MVFCYSRQIGLRQSSAKWNQTEINTIWSHLHVESKKKKTTHRKRDKTLVTRGGGWGQGKLEKGDQNVQTSTL